MRAEKSELMSMMVFGSSFETPKCRLEENQKVTGIMIVQFCSKLSSQLWGGKVVPKATFDV